MKTGTSSIQENTKAAIIALEKQALELWNNGNPSGFTELSDDDVVYSNHTYPLVFCFSRQLTDCRLKQTGRKMRPVLSLPMKTN